jgi:hypothetical protein
MLLAVVIIGGSLCLVVWAAHLAAAHRQQSGLASAERPIMELGMLSETDRRERRSPPITISIPLAGPAGDAARLQLLAARFGEGSLFIVQRCQMRSRIDAELETELRQLSRGGDGPPATIMVRTRCAADHHRLMELARAGETVPFAILADILQRASFTVDWPAPERHFELDGRRLRGAHEKSLALLMEWLTPEQRDQFDRDGAFKVVGSDSGKRYLIRRAGPYNISELDDFGSEAAYWCFVPKPPALAAGDVLLAQKIALEKREVETLNIANRRPASLGLRLQHVEGL